MTPPNAELLRSLGKLARGLSALFWSLPATLIICVETANAQMLKPIGIIPALVANGLLFFGLWQMSDFQKQERPWRNVLDRAKLLAIVNLGLCPFLYWQNKMPQQLFFTAAIFILILSSLLFLFNLNIVLKQLGAMLPDETLRHETKEFTLFNRWLLVLWLVFVAASILALEFGLQTRFDQTVWMWIERGAIAILLFLGLTPLAVTMALIWKTKEVIFDGVFGARQ
ncbi:MAG TPA: hypothetical protein VE344_05535 [Methylomirabilota bacterium]|nr:hypothetical protein [Methylomirabilota bacterium]